MPPWLLTSPAVPTEPPPVRERVASSLPRVRKVAVAAPIKPRTLRRAPGTVLKCADLPPLEHWAGSLIVAATEVLTGSRPVQQLTRWLDQEVYADLARRAGLITRLRGRSRTQTHSRLLAIRAAASPAGHHELSAVVHDGQRVRAVALRVEQFGNRWRASALEIG